MMIINIFFIIIYWLDSIVFAQNESNKKDPLIMYDFQELNIPAIPMVYDNGQNGQDEINEKNLAESNGDMMSDGSTSKQTVKPTLSSSVINKKQKEYYQKNKMRIREQQRLYKQLNKEKIKNMAKEYYQNNKVKVKENNEKYYQENKGKRLEYGKKYYQENKEKFFGRNKKYYQENKDKILESKKKKRGLTINELNLTKRVNCRQEPNRRDLTKFS